MTIIVPVQYELEDGEFIFGLGSDLIYGPWTNPSLMESSKIFQGVDFVWGVTGDISVINIEALEAETFTEFKNNLNAGTSDSIIVVMSGDDVYTYDCNEGKKTWSNATFTGEPLSWGCFNVPFNAKFNRYVIHNADSVYEWISNLHALYGYVFTDEHIITTIVNRCIKFSAIDAKKLGE